MGQSKEVTLEERELAVAEANELLTTLGAEWLEARAKGRVAPKLEAAIEEAEREYNKAANKLEATRKRLAKKK